MQVDYNLNSRVDGVWEIRIEGKKPIRLENREHLTPIINMIIDADMLSESRPRVMVFDSPEKQPGFDLINVDEVKRIIEARKTKDRINSAGIEDI